MVASTPNTIHSFGEEDSSKRRQILDGARKVFMDLGFDGASMNDIVAAAGVSKGTLFLYFPSKEELFKAVVRENISGRFDEWSQELDAYEGSSAELLRYCITVWWERVGSTQAAGISKLMMSEAGNFPELAAFYQAEVIAPGNALVQRVLQRGIDSGEFRPMDLNYGAYLVMAPILFLAISKQSLGSCMPADVAFDPLAYIQTQVDNMLIGLAVRPSPSSLPTS